MSDDLVSVVAAAVDAGLVRWHAGRVELHPDAPADLRARLAADRDDVIALLSPVTDAYTAVLAAFPGAVVEVPAVERYWQNWTPIEPRLPPVPVPRPREPVDEAAIRRADNAARRRVAATPTCSICGGHLTCGQPGRHYGCER